MNAVLRPLAPSGANPSSPRRESAPAGPGGLAGGARVGGGAPMAAAAAAAWWGARGAGAGAGAGGALEAAARVRAPPPSPPGGGAGAAAGEAAWRSPEAPALRPAEVRALAAGAFGGGFGGRAPGLLRIGGEHYVAVKERAAWAVLRALGGAGSLVVVRQGGLALCGFSNGVADERAVAQIADALAALPQME